MFELTATKKIYKKAKYEKRVVAYIDILGFKDIIDFTTTRSGRDDRKSITKLLKVYRIFNELWSYDLLYQKTYRKETAKRVTLFSDCIVVSFLVNNKEEITSTIHTIREMLISLIPFGIICRGAITIGKILHTPTLIFGPALVDAYLRETKEATYPRVILSPQMEKIAKDEVKWIMEGGIYREPRSIVFRDKDGRYYIDYFHLYADDCNYPDMDTRAYLRDLRWIILEGLDLATLKECRHLAPKYHWMREKFNTALKFHKSKSHLEFLAMIEFAYWDNIEWIAKSKPITKAEAKRNTATINKRYFQK